LQPEFHRRDPLLLQKLRYPFRATFEREFLLLEQFAACLLWVHCCAYDTFIPSVLLIDFSTVR
jgi:hypothetical protein